MDHGAGTKVRKIALPLAIAAMVTLAAAAILLRSPNAQEKPEINTADGNHADPHAHAMHAAPQPIVPVNQQMIDRETEENRRNIEAVKRQQR